MQILNGHEYEQSSLFDPEIKEWSRNLDIVLPIRTAEIVGFENWICWNGFSEQHQGFDFAAYLSTKDEIVLGLPGELSVVAVADGNIVQAVKKPFGVAYGGFVNIEHGKEGSGLFSSYHHVVPSEKSGFVRKGDVIGYLYQDPADHKIEGRIVHLHFELTNSWETRSFISENVDPVTIFPEINMFQAKPQSELAFKIKRNLGY